jgi:ribose transport system ATP-binding protein
VTSVMEATNLSKTFGSQTVLNGVSITLKAGEVRGLIGQNGSGKSTLVKILAGFHEPDEGASLRIRGHDIAFPLAPGESQSSGIGIVHQDLGLIGSLTVWENLSIGALGGGRFGVVNPSKLKARSAQALAEFGLDIDPDAQVRDLSRMERATLAILRASRQSRLSDGEHERNVLVLDETSAFLPLEERQQLYSLVRTFAEGGGAVLYIAHDLEEMFAVADSITVLRDGHAVATMPTSSTSIPDIISLMIGGQGMVAHTRSTRVESSGGAAAVVSGLCSSVISPSDFMVGPGEILGVTGLVGSGVDELPYTLFGADDSAAGTLSVGGVTLDLASISTAAALRAGVGLVPADRANDGGIAELPAYENITMPTLRRRLVGGLLRSGVLAKQAKGLVQQYGVKPASETALFGSFSGGNQQKMILAKWLETDPQFLILHEPVQGVDVAARADLLRRISASADRGLPILCVSTDAVLLAELCSRVLVLANGEFVDELSGDDITEQSITFALLGEREKKTSPPERSTP